MQSVYDIYHHFCILLQDDLRLSHRVAFTNGSTDVVLQGTLKRAYKIQETLRQMEVASPLSAYNQCRGLEL